MFHIVQLRETPTQPWANDSGYKQAFEARSRTRLLRRYGGFETRIVERKVFPRGLPTYNNVTTMKDLNAIRRGTLITDKDFS